MSEQTTQPAVEPVVTVNPDGTVQIGTGYSIGDVLQALDLARRAVLGIVPVRAQTQAVAE